MASYNHAKRHDQFQSREPQDDKRDSDDEIIQFDDLDNQNREQYEPGQGAIYQAEKDIKLVRLEPKADVIKMEQKSSSSQIMHPNPNPNHQQNDHQYPESESDSEMSQSQANQKYQENGLQQEPSLIDIDQFDKESVIEQVHQGSISRRQSQSQVNQPAQSIIIINGQQSEENTIRLNPSQQTNSESQAQANNPFYKNYEIEEVKKWLDGDEELQKRLNMNKEEVRKEFLTSPLKRNDRTLQCFIRRDKSGLARLYPVYHVYTNNGNLYLFSAKKVVMNTTSNYVISMSKSDFSTKSPNFIGKVRSNFLGTEFQIFDGGKNPSKTKDVTQYRCQLGIVYYESHIMQNKGPRVMKVLLPKVGAQNIPKVFQPMNSKQGIQFDYDNNKREYIDEYVNKPPRWDPKMKAHVLNFYGRVDQPSVKNFQLIKKDEGEKIYLQFGRVNDLTFNLDFTWPMSPLQAFEICVTSFDFKIACE